MDMADALDQSCALVSDSVRLVQTRDAALAWSVAHQGATRRTLDALGACASLQ
jgi:hypothetical protein